LATKEWKRDTIDSREVLTAFRLDDGHDLLREPKGTAHIGVFSFLPLKDVPSGLEFLIQADFLTAPGRESIHREALWNDWLADSVLELITQKCIPTFLAHERWRMTFTDILYPGEWEHPMFDDHIKTPLRHYLENNPVFIAKDGSFVSAKDAVYLINADQRDLVTEDDIEALYPGKRLLAQECRPHLRLRNLMTEGPNFNSRRLSGEMKRLIERKAVGSDIEWFKHFYQQITYEKNTLRKFLRHQDLVLMEDGNLAAANEARIKPEGLNIPEGIESRFNLVHPELAADPDSVRVMTKLGVAEITEEDVRIGQIPEEIEALRKAWPSLPEDKRIEETSASWQKSFPARDPGVILRGGQVHPEFR